MILNEKVIRSKMIKYDVFQGQLFSARNELNIAEDILKESELRLQNVGEFKNRILDILDQDEPVLAEMLTTFKSCY
jgi:hypothetical protein